MSLVKYDEKVARTIHNQLNCIGITENAVFPEEKKKENYRPRTLVDDTLEYIDPTPNIYTLFVQFNEKFFWNVLLPVQVKWSPRMTSCAGVCTFHPRNRECVIALSNPLLKLRPRKDLIETLLHEMIHAYLFLTNNNRDRDGHGPVFQSHMKRINKEAGTNITIYHTFHDEVRLYQQHWWRCNGPCQNKAPFFGTVRRAMNRAPGPNDFWWKEHQFTCGGQFIKIKEPEKPETRKKKTESKTSSNTNTEKKLPQKTNSVLNWIKKTDNDQTKNVQNKNLSNKSNLPKIASGSSNITNNTKNVQTDLKKLGNSTNNVHGWGIGGPGSTSSTNTLSNNKDLSSNSPKKPRLSFSGTLGGTGTGKSILLDKFANTTTVSSKKSNLNNHFNNSKRHSSTNSPLENITKTVKCPSCNKSVDESKINEHLDMCLENPQEPEIIPSSSNKKRKSMDIHTESKKKVKNQNQSSSEEIECPLCNKKIKPDSFNNHLDSCLQNGFHSTTDDFEEKTDDVVSIHDSSSSSVNLHDSPHLCLICDKALEPTMTLSEHLEECVASVFNDSNTEDNFDTTKADEKQTLESYPCPICMTLIEESLMNDHVDNCLTKSK